MSETCGTVLSTDDRFYEQAIAFAIKKAFECNSDRTFVTEHQGVTNVIIGAKDKDAFQVMVHDNIIKIEEMVGVGMNRAQARDYAYKEFMGMVREL